MPQPHRGNLYVKPIIHVSPNYFLNNSLCTAVVSLPRKGVVSPKVPLTPTSGRSAAYEIDVMGYKPHPGTRIKNENYYEGGLESNKKIHMFL